MAVELPTHISQVVLNVQKTPKPARRGRRSDRRLRVPYEIKWQRWSKKGGAESR